MGDELNQFMNEPVTIGMLLMSATSLVAILSGAVMIWTKLSRTSQIRNDLEIIKLAQDCEGCSEALKRELWNHVYKLSGVMDPVKPQLRLSNVSPNNASLLRIVMGILVGVGLTIFSSIAAVVGLAFSFDNPDYFSVLVIGLVLSLGGFSLVVSMFRKHCEWLKVQFVATPSVSLQQITEGS